jgi:hypothetical protein
VRIHVGAVGRLKAGPERKLAELYLERAGALGRSAGISPVNVAEIAESRAATVEPAPCRRGRPAARRDPDEASRSRSTAPGAMSPAKSSLP